MSSLFIKSRPILGYNDRFLCLIGGFFLSVTLSLVFFGQILVENEIGVFFIFMFWVMLNVAFQWFFYRLIYLKVTKKWPTTDRLWKKYLILVPSVLLTYTFFTWITTITVDPIVHEKLPRTVMPALIIEVTSSVVFIFAVIFLYEGIYLYNLLKRNQYEKELLEKEKLISQYESVTYQLRPHFLFNSLNNINALFKENPASSTKYLEELISVYHYILRNGAREKVPLQQELEFLERYINLQKLRFQESFIISIDIPGSLGRKHIVPVSLQIAVENALKHNKMSKMQPLKIRIKGEEEKITVSNDLFPKKVETSTRLGLENLRNRYRLITEEPLEISKNADLFEIRLPLV